MKIKKASIFFLLLLSSLSFADTGQYLPDLLEKDYVNGQKDDDEYFDGDVFVSDLKNKNSDDELVFEGDQVTKKDEGKRAFIEATTDIDTKISKKEKVKGVQSPAMDEIEDNSRYIEYSKESQIDEASKLHRSQLTFTFFKDDFDYKNNANNFKKVYRDSEKNDPYGILRVGINKFITRDVVSFLMGGGIGIGYNGGKGVFSDRSTGDSDAYAKSNFSLWTIPLDISLGMEVTMSRYMQFAIQGGPSVIGLIQNRQDRKDSNEQKSRRQFSYGYFASAALKFNISNISKNLGFKLLSDDNVNRFFLNLEARTHNYSNFKENGVSIGGNSFGLGFTYDFI